MHTINCQPVTIKLAARTRKLQRTRPVMEPAQSTGR